MTIEEFLNAPLDSLAEATGIDKFRWSKYLNGHLMSEKTLNKAAEGLQMRPEVLLLAINKRRESKDCVNQQPELVS